MIFSQVAKVCLFLKRLAVSHRLQINNNNPTKTDVSRGTHMCLNIT